MRLASVGAMAASLSLGLTGPAPAELVRFEVATDKADALGGRTFGPGGSVRKITGRATIAVDPSDPRNAVVADIALAPRDADGRVEASADVVILRPARPNGLMLVELPNRGRKLIGPLVEGSSTEASGRLDGASDAGRGFLIGLGTTLVWVGWQGDLPAGSGLRAELPVVPNVTGPSREEWIFDHVRSPVEAPLTWPAANLDSAKARLTVRARPDDARATPPGLGFRFVSPDRIEISRPAAGFDGSALYELVYEARDPKVMGLGLAAVRDVSSFLRHETGPANPLAAEGRTGIDRAVGFGVSQSGRVLRDFLHLGFNEDERGRVVFEGMMPHIAGSRRSFTNARFAQPGRNPAPHGDRYYPADQFPFTYGVTTDALTGRRDGLLLRCRLSNTCPRIMHVDAEYEMWGSRGALTTTDTRGHGLDLPPEVRAYMIAGAPHFAPPDGKVRTDPSCALPVSPLHGGAVSRALLVALDRWIADGIEPPASRYPSRAAGTLAGPDGLYPAIPGLPYRGLFNPAEWVEQTGTAPVVRGAYPLLLPRVDRDGNTIGGIRLPVHEVPRATYTAWNPTVGLASATLCNQLGGVLPFAATRAERDAAGDPRPSLAERYPTAEAYVSAVAAASARLGAERLLLPGDVAETVEAARAGTLAP